MNRDDLTGAVARLLNSGGPLDPPENEDHAQARAVFLDLELPYRAACGDALAAEMLAGLLDTTGAPEQAQEVRRWTAKGARPEGAPLCLRAVRDAVWGRLDPRAHILDPMRAIQADPWSGERTTGVPVGAS